MLFQSCSVCDEHKAFTYGNKCVLFEECTIQNDARCILNVKHFFFASENLDTRFTQAVVPFKVVVSQFL